MMTIDEIQSLIKEGKVDEALSALQDVLKAEPENVEAEMLLGTCCQLKGDSVAFNAVYEDVRPQMEARELSGEQSSAVSLWKRYKALWVMVFVSASLLAGLVDRQIRLNDKDGQLQTTQSRVETISNDLQVAQVHVKAMSGELQTTQSRVETMSAELQVANSKLESLQGALQKDRSQNRNLSAELERTKDSLSRTEDQLRSAKSKLRAFENDDEKHYNIVHEYVEEMLQWRARHPPRELHLDTSGISDLKNFCNRILGYAAIEKALESRRGPGLAVIKLPDESDGDGEDDLSNRDLVNCNFILLLRVDLGHRDSDDSIRQRINARLDMLKSSYWPYESLDEGTDVMQDRWGELIRLISGDLKDVTWEIPQKEIPQKKIGSRRRTRRNDYGYAAHILKGNICELQALVEGQSFSCLELKRRKKEVILGFKIENTLYLGGRSAYGVPRDYGDRTPKRILAPDGTVIYQVDEQAIRRHYLEQENKYRRDWDNRDDDDF